MPTDKVLEIKMTGELRQQETFEKRAMAYHMESGGVSLYTNYPFIGFGKLGDIWIGASSDGLFVLSGNTDNGDNINSIWATGYTDDFGLQDLDSELLKKAASAYVGYRTDGDLVLESSIDGDNFAREYTLNQHCRSPGLSRQVVRLGSGINSRYWKFEIRNVDGCDFVVEELGVEVIPTSRKAGKM